MDSSILQFIENDKNIPWIQFLQNLYEEINIHRALIIVKNNENIIDISNTLENEGHSVYIPSNLNILLDFKEYLDSLKRIYIISYDYFIHNKDLILMRIIPETNLFITYNLSEINEDECNEFLVYSRKSGHMNKLMENYIWNYYKNKLL